MNGPSSDITRMPAPARRASEKWQAGDLPYLSALHNEIRREARRYRADPGTAEWSNWDGVRSAIGNWLGNRTNAQQDERFKSQWVHGNRATINAAAKRFDLPAELLGGVAFKEVGGKPPFVDRVMEMVRSEEGRNIGNPLPHQFPGARDVAEKIRKRVNAPESYTSLGPLEVQFRRSAEALGYPDVHRLSETQYRQLRRDVEDPATNIFIAAKHLSDLRDTAFGRTPAVHIGPGQMQNLAAMYNGGPGTSERNNDAWRYGRDFASRLDKIRELLADPTNP